MSRNKSHKPQPQRKKATMSMYNDILNETTEKKTLTIEQQQKVQQLRNLLLRHEEALEKALDRCSKISDEAQRVETLGSIKAEHIRATAAIRKELEELTGTPVPLSTSISKMLDNASEITIKVSGAAGAVLGKALRTPAQTIGGFFKRMAQEIES